MENLNKTYFNLLKQNIGRERYSILLNCPQNCPEGNAIPYSIAKNSELNEFNVINYTDIKNDSYSTEPINLNIIKMQAGLGSSVKRDDIIEKYANRKTLGAKGTDLFFKLGGNWRSISELQLIQAANLEKEEFIESITYTNLVNEETKDVVQSDWRKEFEGNSYENIFYKSNKLNRGETIVQQKMPTIGDDGELTTDRMAPAGHGFIGISELIKVFNSSSPNAITVIGNGEDLNSTPELPLLKWTSSTKAPVVMITTSKTDQDLKGGQISLVKNDGNHFLTIVEKAQAEESNQLQYFEALGLRENDREALFNTNVVVINEAALKEKFRLLGNLSMDEFLSSIAPDVISNKKEQDGKIFTQLESALGSVMLNLDSFFRKNYQEKIVSIVNIDQADRENFFIPIKKREDYDQLISDFYVSGRNYRLLRQVAV